MRTITKAITLTKTTGFALLALTSAQAATDYPTRPVRLIVGFPPGGGADIVARVVANRMAQELGQPMIVENRAGAGSTIASGHVAGADPDGYTLLLGNALLFGMDKAMYKTIRYSAQDFAPVTQWVRTPLLLAVNTDFPVKSVQDLVATARENPGKYFFSSSGNGSSPHLAGVLFNQLAGVNMSHVPYKGGANAVHAVVANEAQLTFGTASSLLPLIEGGRLRGLAVTSEQPSALFPGLPSVADEGMPGFDLSSWFGLLAPTGTSSEIVQKLFTVSQTVLNDPEVRHKLAQQGNEVVLSDTPLSFGQWMIAEGQKAKTLAESAALTAD